jgi:hypothetical protein
MRRDFARSSRFFPAPDSALNSALKVRHRNFLSAPKKTLARNPETVYIIDE